jgi:hypothetical protein
VGSSHRFVVELLIPGLGLLPISCAALSLMLGLSSQVNHLGGIDCQN